MAPFAQTPGRATRSSVKAARDRGDAEQLYGGLPDTARKSKTAAPLAPVRIPFADIVNNATDTHARSPDSVSSDICKADTCAAEATTPKKNSSISHAFEPEHVDDADHSSASSDTCCAEEVLSGNEQEGTDFTQQLSSPDVRQSTPEVGPVQSVSSPTPGRWECDATTTPEATTEFPRAPMTAVKSKVVVAESFEPRSLRQLKKEYRELKAAREAPALDESASDPEDDGEDDECRQDAGSSNDDADSSAEDLAAALDGLCIGAPDAGSKVLLRGVPVAKGAHLRFEGDQDEAVLTPGANKVALRGIPQAAGRHMRFD